MNRPKINSEILDEAIQKATLSELELDIIEYIRFVGTFSQPLVVKALKINSRPPVLSVLCSASRKIGKFLPEHFEQVREWSKLVSADGVRWDGDLICSATFNIDGTRLSPEFKTTQFHNFAVHPEFFTGL